MDGSVWGPLSCESGDEVCPLRQAFADDGRVRIPSIDLKRAYDPRAEPVVVKATVPTVVRG
ncbi:MAG: hypothetical protein LZF60_270030 [Nitrospira sp.]|nr:MAG: hypothetical protein LZF60_270030 [Nitrospira sp.]